MDMKGDIGYQEKMIKEVSAQLYVGQSGFFFLFWEFSLFRGELFDG